MGAVYFGRVEAIKIVGLAIVAAVLYGILHDQVTARICVEYFTVFHPPVFPTHSPTLLALGWGVIATWWAGAMIGLALMFAARAGARPQMSAQALVPYVAILMAAMAACALLCGLIGYLWAPIPPEISDVLPPAMQRRFLADWWAHGASYLTGFAGGAVLCAVVWMRRKGLARA